MKRAVRKFRNVGLGAVLTGALIACVAVTPAQASEDETAADETTTTSSAVTVDTLSVLSDIVDLTPQARAALSTLVGEATVSAAPEDSVFDGIVATEAGATVLLPTAEDSSAAVLGSESLGARVPGAEVTRTEGVVSVLENKNETFVVAPGSTGGVQFINIATEHVVEHSFDVETSIPEGASWSVLPDGGLQLIDAVGSLSAYVETPWAVDANGVSLPTHFTVEGGMITQHVDTSNATFPVVSDPSIWTVAECLGSIALLIGFAAAKMATVIAKIATVIKKTTTLVNKWKAAIGSANFSAAEFKTFAGLLQGWMNNTLTAAKRTKVNALMNAAGATLLTIVGLEACWKWYKNG
ncbi:hypothetical protein D9V32_03765 [Mycetocola tolaasinivorans]|uniref:Uncharacterized protein n=1 Tax=Mycetocola tolaasinivorans TaxID=76635 RepID=A0A3L7A8V7_9MICO|nr:hypothetical protein [Mycetocola tolaasinivorans]RLP76769.1 hypothetical protein D9V32_03765 [Mycetocola tolaasinivorans]